MHKKEHEYQILYDSWQQQSYHLHELKKVEEKFVKLSELFGQVGKIVSQPADPAPFEIPPSYNKVHTPPKPFFILQEDRKSTRLNSSHSDRSRMPSSA